MGKVYDMRPAGSTATDTQIESDLEALPDPAPKADVIAALIAAGRVRATTPLPAPTFSAAIAGDAAEGATRTVTLTINRDGLAGAVSETWTVAGEGANPAVAADFVGGVFPSGTWSIADAATTTTVSLATVDDALVEPTKGYRVTFLYNGQAVASVSATITSEDVEAPVGDPGPYSSLSDWSAASYGPAPTYTRSADASVMTLNNGWLRLTAAVGKLFPEAVDERALTAGTTYDFSIPVPAFTAEQGFSVRIKDSANPNGTPLFARDYETTTGPISGTFVATAQVSIVLNAETETAGQYAEFGAVTIAPATAGNGYQLEDGSGALLTEDSNRFILESV